MKFPFMYRELPATPPRATGLLDDTAFWDQQKALMLNTMIPIWREAYCTGATIASVEANIPVNYDAVRTAAFDFIVSYIPVWWDRTLADTRAYIARTAAAVYKAGLGTEEATALLSAPDPINAAAATEIGAALEHGRAYVLRAAAPADTLSPATVDHRAGPPKIQQERLDTEDDVKRAIEGAWRFARDRIAKIGGA